MSGFPPLAGGAGIVQGRYGRRGNLELVVPDPADGLWVFWHNTDPDEPEGDVGPGRWSGGLRFAGGRRWSDVRVVQSAHGSHHLELLARRENVVERLRWSPETAFTEEGVVLDDATGAPALAETPGGDLHAMIPTTTGVAHLRADATAYPTSTTAPAYAPWPPPRRRTTPTPSTWTSSPAAGRSSTTRRFPGGPGR